MKEKNQQQLYYYYVSEAVLFIKDCITSHTEELIAMKKLLK